MKAYYFATQARRLQYGDGRVITVGATHTVEGAIELCANGLHASLTPFDALHYAPGPILYLVRLSGTIVQGDDKCAASERTYLAEYDATELLRSYARWCALRHIEKIKPYCSADEHATISTYLNTGDEALREAARAAAEAAWDAAGAAAGAARAAAEAVWDAAGVAWDAAGVAVGAAAWAAAGVAWDAAEAAERKALVYEFNRLVQEATGWEA